MDQPINHPSATLHALLRAERERNGQAVRQMEETRNILIDFIQRTALENNTPAAETIPHLDLLQLARFAVELANLIIIRQRNAINDCQSIHSADLKAEIHRLEDENQSLKILAEASTNPPIPAPAIDCATSAPAVRDACAQPLGVLTPDAVEERIVQIAGSIQTIRLGGLVTACIESLGLPADEIKAAIDRMVNKRLLDVCIPSYAPRRGEEYPPVFQLTDAGLAVFGQASSQTPVQNLEQLSNANIWKKEGALLAAIFEELLPGEGYAFVRYLPEVGVFSAERGNHIFRPHVQMSDPGKQTAYAMYAGERYEKGVLGLYLDDFLQVDAGRMYFVAATTRTARQLVSDITYLLRSRKLDAHPYVSNLDYLIQLVRDRAAGNLSSKDACFMAVQK